MTVCRWGHVCVYYARSVWPDVASNAGAPCFVGQSLASPLIVNVCAREASVESAAAG